MQPYQQIFFASARLLRESRNQTCAYLSEEASLIPTCYQNLISIYQTVKAKTDSISVMQIELHFEIIRNIRQDRLENDVVRGLFLLKGLLLAVSIQ